MSDQPYAPMLCMDAPKVNGELVLPVGPEWRFETKLDGWRWMVQVTEHGVRSWSGRNGQERTGSMPEIEAALAYLPADTVLDGELIVGDGDTGRLGSPAVATALAEGRGATFVVFDILRVSGADVTYKPYSARRELLIAASLGFDGEHVRLSEDFPAQASVYDDLLARGFEGVIAKRINGVYRPGKRSDNFTKVKPQETAEAVVVGFIDGKSGIAGLVGAFELRMLNGGVVTSCAVPPALRREVTNHGADLWLGRVIEFAHHGIRLDSGKPRHPVFRCRRDDR